MDINQQHGFPNTTWELGTSMEDHQHILQNQLLLDALIWPHDFPLQAHHQIQISSPSSSHIPTSSTCLFSDQTETRHVSTEGGEGEGERGEEAEEEELGAMKEMMYKIAAMQPVDIDPATVRKPRRRNVRISDDPQSIAARHRRERISEKIRILQRLVPGGTKMDTASMLDEAIRYVKFLKRHIRQLQQHSHHHPPARVVLGHATTNLTGDWHVGPNKGVLSSAASASVDPSEAVAPIIIGRSSNTRGN